MNNILVMWLPVWFMIIIPFLIIIYFLLALLNKEKKQCIDKKPRGGKYTINELLVILDQLFVFSGIGFIVINIVESLILSMSFKLSYASWSNLIFGLLIFFIGLGCKVAWKHLLKEKR